MGGRGWSLPQLVRAGGVEVIIVVDTFVIGT